MSYGTMSVSERQLLPPAVAVSTVAFALRPPEGAPLGPNEPRVEESAATIWIPLVRRNRLPFSGSWALPGGPIPWNETLVDTALRALRDAVRREPGYLEQLYSFGAVERSAEAQRVVTIAYWALYGEQDLVGSHTGGVEADPAILDPNVAWFSADALPDLAFDHNEIVAYALDRLRSKTEYSTVAYRFLGRSFTLAQLREVREAILGAAIDPANFRRQVLAQGHVVPTGAFTSGDSHRPARLYQFVGSSDVSKVDSATAEDSHQNPPVPPRSNS